MVQVRFTMRGKVYRRRIILQLIMQEMVFLPVPHMTSEVPDSITFTPRRNVRLEADAAADV